MGGYVKRYLVPGEYLLKLLTFKLFAIHFLVGGCKLSLPFLCMLLVNDNLR